MPEERYVTAGRALVSRKREFVNFIGNQLQVVGQKSFVLPAKPDENPLSAFCQHLPL